LPDGDLAAARFGVVQAQLRLERPANVQIWVADIATARGWAKLPAVTLAVVASRFVDPRFHTQTNYLYTSGGKLDDAEQTALAEAGLRVALELMNLSNPPRTIDELLPPPPRWAPSRDDRPVPAHDVLGQGLLGQELVRVISGMAYIDLRRADLSAIDSGTVFTSVDDAIAALASIRPLTHVTWVVAPWVLERLGDDHVRRIAASVALVAPTVTQRLAIIVAQGESLADYPLTRRLGETLRPLDVTFSWRTAEHGEFEVRPVDALHDAYFASAWKQPRG
jgi:hypothetical protein